jgi:hypothetical protein
MLFLDKIPKQQSVSLVRNAGHGGKGSSRSIPRKCKEDGERQEASKLTKGRPTGASLEVSTVRRQVRHNAVKQERMRLQAARRASVQVEIQESKKMITQVQYDYKDATCVVEIHCAC